MPAIKKIIHEAPVTATYNQRFGWYPPRYLEKIRNLLKEKLQRMIAGTSEPSLAELIAADPDLFAFGTKRPSKQRRSDPPAGSSASRKRLKTRNEEGTGGETSMGEKGNPMAEKADPMAEKGNPMAEKGNPIAEKENPRAENSNSMAAGGEPSRAEKGNPMAESETTIYTATSNTTSLLSPASSSSSSSFSFSSSPSSSSSLSLPSNLPYNPSFSSSSSTTSSTSSPSPSPSAFSSSPFSSFTFSLPDLPVAHEQAIHAGQAMLDELAGSQPQKTIDLMKELAKHMPSRALLLENTDHDATAGGEEAAEEKMDVAQARARATPPTPRTPPLGDNRPT
eukprot:g15976.t1